MEEMTRFTRFENQKTWESLENVWNCAFLLPIPAKYFGITLTHQAGHENIKKHLRPGSSSRPLWNAFSCLFWKRVCCTVFIRHVRSRWEKASAWMGSFSPKIFRICGGLYFSPTIFHHFSTKMFPSKFPTLEMFKFTRSSYHHSSLVFVPRPPFVCGLMRWQRVPIISLALRIPHIVTWQKIRK